MAINPKTGLEEVTPSTMGGLDKSGNVDSQTPLNAQSKGGLSTEQNAGLQTRYDQLRATGLSQADATSRIKGELQTSGVYDTAKNLYNQQSQAPVAPASIQPPQQETNFNAPPQPVSTTTIPTPAPVVEKTTTTTPQGETVVKKETPGEIKPDYNVGKGREQEIAQNLQEGFANDPAIQKAILNGDRASFDMAYGYNESDPTKQKILDYFFKSRQPSSPDEYFNQMTQGISMNNPSLQKNPLFQKARTRFNDLNINAGLTANELAGKLSDGSINIGSQAYTDLQMKNPELLRNAEMLNSINTGTGNKKVDSNTVLTNVSNNLLKNVSKEDIPNYQKMLSENAQVVEAKDKWSEAKAKKDKLQDIIDNTEDEIRKQYEGKDITESYLQSKIYEITKGLTRQFNTASREESSQLANLNYYSDIVKEDYDAQKEERKTAQAQALAEQQATSAFERQKQLADYQAQLGLDVNQAEFDQKVKQQAQLASDPYTAIQTVMEQYQKLGVPFTQSIATKVADANAFISNGGTIGEYVDKMIKDVQAKPEYKALTAPTTSIEKPFTVSKDSYVYDPATGTFKSPTAGTGVTGADVYQQMTASTNPIGVYATGDMDGSRHASIYKTAQEMGLDSFINKYEGTKITSEMVNKAAQEYGVDPLMIAATMALDSSMGTKGKGARNNNPGNIGQFDSLDAQGITVKGYPTLQDGINAVANNLLKRQNALGVSSMNGEKKEREYTDSDIALLSSVTKLDKQGKETLKDNGYTEKEWANFQAGLLPPTSRQKADAKNIVDKVDGIFAGDWSDAVGPIKSMIWTGAGSDRKVTELKVNALKDLLAMANLDKIKGAMSDKDIEFLRNTATYLSTDLSEDEFEKTLNEIKNKYAGIVQGTPTTGTQTNTGAGVVNYNGFNLPK